MDLLHYGFGSSDVGDQAFERFLHNQVHPDGCGQVKHGVDPRDNVIDKLGIKNRPEHKLDIRPTIQVFDIGEPPS